MAYQTIAQRENNVAMKLGNRQDLLAPAVGSGNNYSRIDGWLRDAYISVAYSRTFSESEQTITFQTTQGADTYSYPTTVRAIKSLVGQRGDNNAPVIVTWKNINYIRRYSTPGSQQSGGTAFLGTPSIVAPWANTVVFRPVPDSVPYIFYIDAWMKPVIANIINPTAQLNTTQLVLPDDWLEVVDYEAAYRGHMELLERDKAAEISKLLYGYTDPSTGAKIQGIVDRLGNRDQAQSPYIDYGMQPKFQQSYTNAG
jgi:hypothetical protein